MFLLCGLTGAGKTTLARQLAKRHNAVRFSPDEWMIRLYGRHMSRDLFDQRLQVCYDLILETSERLLATGTHVVLDHGLWRRDGRAALADWLRARGVSATLYYLDVPPEVLWQRLEQRNLRLDAQTFEISRDMLQAFSAQFEPPDAGEGFEFVRLGPDDRLEDERLPPRGR